MAIALRNRWRRAKLDEDLRVSRQGFPRTNTASVAKRVERVDTRAFGPSSLHHERRVTLVGLSVSIDQVARTCFFFFWWTVV